MVLGFQSQWPYSPRCGSAAVRLLGLRVRIPRGRGCLSLENVVCYHVEVSAAGRSRVQRSPTECGVSACDLETSTMRMPRPTSAAEPEKENGV